MNRHNISLTDSEKIKNGVAEVVKASGDNEEEENAFSPNLDFKPIIELPLVDVKTMEEDEIEMIKLRARLYRFETEIEDEPGEWKERGTGEVKLLKAKSNHVRILMRRDKTLKLCANHYVRSDMELKSHQDSDKTWVWSTGADFSDETPKAELLCIRFKNAEIALSFKAAFEEAKELAVEAELKHKEFLDALEEQFEEAETDDDNNAESSNEEEDSIIKQMDKVKLEETHGQEKGSEDPEKSEKTLAQKSDAELIKSKTSEKIEKSTPSDTLSDQAVAGKVQNDLNESEEKVFVENKPKNDSQSEDSK